MQVLVFIPLQVWQKQLLQDLMVQMVWQMWLRQVQNLEPLLIQTILKDMQLIKISIIVRIVMGMVFRML